MRLLDNIFHFESQGSTVSREFLGGLTTFLTMAYIIFVNPIFLTKGGIPLEGAILATCLASAIATFLMGIFANYPIALAPGMGMNAFFAYTICQKAEWPVALGVVFVSSLGYFVLTVTKFRETLVNAIPVSLKLASGVGIGLMLALIGLEQGGLVGPHPATLVTVGEIKSPPALLTLFGLGATLVLVALKIRTAIFWGIIATIIMALITGLTHFPERLFQVPSFELPGFKIDILGSLKIGLVDLMIALLFINLFDTLGTLMAVGYQGGFIKDGKLPRIGKTLIADAFGAVQGALCGTPPVTSYIESGAGIGVGARTGLANIVTGLLFALAIFFIPLAGIVGSAIIYENKLYYPITAAALIMVGALMVKCVKEIPWDDVTEAVPSFIALIIMPLTLNIAHGLMAGIIFYTLMKVVAGRFKEVHILLYILTILFLARYAFLPL